LLPSVIGDETGSDVFIEQTVRAAEGLPVGLNGFRKAL